MPHRLLNESFDGDALHPLLQWMNPPAVWRIDPARSRLLVSPDAGTDFWQETHYGFRLDNGHFLSAEVPGDAVATAAILCHPAHQYDQAGLMVRFSEQCWLKASAEYEPDGPSHLGVVVTNSGFSDWSLQDFPYGGALSYCLRIRREGHDFLVEHAAGENGPWNLMRIARLLPNPDHRARIGLYACSPKGSGCRVEARFLRIEFP